MSISILEAADKAEGVEGDLVEGDALRHVGIVLLLVADEAIVDLRISNDHKEIN